MNSSIDLEIVAQVMQSVNAGEPEQYEIFASPFANVQLHAHPALLPLLHSNAYYSQSPSAADDWTVSAVESAHLWETAATQIKPTWAPVMDCGADGYITDVDRDMRLIVSPVTRTLIVRDRAQRKVYVAGHDARGLFVELFRIVRAVHTVTALMGGAVGLRSSTVSRNGRAVCFVGHEGARKSTALLAAATAHLDGLSILTSDRALAFADGGLQLLAWPSAISAGAGILRTLGAADVLTPEFRYRNMGPADLLLGLPSIESLAPPDERSAPAQIRLLPEEMRRVMGSHFVAESRAAAIIESELAPDETRSELSIVQDAEQKAEVLSRNMLPVRSSHPDWLGLMSCTARSPRTEALTAQALDDVFVARLRVGADGKDVTRGLVASLTSREMSVPLLERGGSAPLPTYHFGVYARVLQDGQMLCVRKTRGPYTGLLDLPGGRPEFAESWEAALRRELWEEVGADHVGLSAFERFALHVERDSRGEPIDFHHHGALAVSIFGTPCLPTRPPLQIRPAGSGSISWEATIPAQPPRSLGFGRHVTASALPAPMSGCLSAGT